MTPVNLSPTDLAQQALKILKVQIDLMQEAALEGALNPSQLRLLMDCLKTLSTVSKDYDLHDEQEDMMAKLSLMPTDAKNNYIIDLCKSVGVELYIKPKEA